MGLFHSMPIYVTRKTADGLIASYSLSAWMPLLALLIVWANVVGWGIYGLVNLVGNLIEAAA